MLKKGEILHEVLLSSLKDILLTRLIKIDFKFTPHGYIITLQCHFFKPYKHHQTRNPRLKALRGTNNQESDFLLDRDPLLFGIITAYE